MRCWTLGLSISHRHQNVGATRDSCCGGSPRQSVQSAEPMKPQPAHSSPHPHGVLQHDSSQPCTLHILNRCKQIPTSLSAIDVSSNLTSRSEWWRSESDLHFGALPSSINSDSWADQQGRRGSCLCASSSSRSRRNGGGGGFDVAEREVVIVGQSVSRVCVMNGEVW